MREVATLWTITELCIDENTNGIFGVRLEADDDCSRTLTRKTTFPVVLQFVEILAPITNGIT